MQIFLKQDVESSDVKLMTNYIDQMLRNPHLYLELNHQTSEQNRIKAVTSYSHVIVASIHVSSDLFFNITTINTITHLCKMINLPQNIIAHETMKKIGVFRNTLHEPTDLHVTYLSSKKLDKIYRKLLTLWIKCLITTWANALSHCY